MEEQTSFEGIEIDGGNMVTVKSARNIPASDGFRWGQLVRFVGKGRVGQVIFGKGPGQTAARIHVIEVEDIEVLEAP